MEHQDGEYVSDDGDHQQDGLVVALEHGLVDEADELEEIPNPREGDVPQVLVEHDVTIRLARYVDQEKGTEQQRKSCNIQPECYKFHTTLLVPV